MERPKDTGQRAANTIGTHQDIGRVLLGVASRDDRYTAMLRTGLQSRRFFVPEELVGGDARWLPLLDLLTESPSLAPFALIGLSASDREADRVLAAAATPAYEPFFPLEIEEVLNALQGDRSQKVSQRARDSLTMIGVLRGLVFRAT